MLLTFWTTEEEEEDTCFLLGGSLGCSAAGGEVVGEGFKCPAAAPPTPRPSRGEGDLTVIGRGDVVGERSCLAAVWGEEGGRGGEGGGEVGSGGMAIFVADAHLDDDDEEGDEDNTPPPPATPTTPRMGLLLWSESQAAEERVLEEESRGKTARSTPSSFTSTMET